MKITKIVSLAILGSVAAAAMGQGITTRVFTYDGSLATNGLVTYQVNGDGPSASVFAGYIAGNVYGQNGYNNATYTNVQLLAQTLINVATYVYISGNFGGVYNVTGIGTATDLVQTNQVEVRTNRNLTFTATGFYGIGPTIGSISYGMSLFQDYPSNGVQIGPTLTATDGGFNGATLGLNVLTSLPADGRATLQLTRQLTLTQQAIGAQHYTAAGYIQVGVN